MRIHLKHVVIACVCVVGVVMLRDGASAPSRRGRPRGVSNNIPSHIPALKLCDDSAAPIFALLLVPHARASLIQPDDVQQCNGPVQFQNSIGDSVATTSPVPR